MPKAEGKKQPNSHLYLFEWKIYNYLLEVADFSSSLLLGTPEQLPLINYSYILHDRFINRNSKFFCYF